MHQPPDDHEHRRRDAIFDQPTERDLFRIATDKRLSPPPSDSESPLWSEAWAHFGLIYTPALRRYVYNVLCSVGRRATALDDAEDIVSEFESTRIEDGRLNAQGIRKFRHWLAAQARRFTYDWLRKQTAQRNRPVCGFADPSSLEGVAANGADSAALTSFAEQLVADVSTFVLDRVGEKNEKYAHVVRDLVLNDGRQSSDIAEQIGVRPDRVRDIRRRARSAFRTELLKLVREGPFAEGDIEDLIRMLKRMFDGPSTSRATRGGASATQG